MKEAFCEVSAMTSTSPSRLWSSGYPKGLAVRAGEGPEPQEGQARACWHTGHRSSFDSHMGGRVSVCVCSPAIPVLVISAYYRDCFVISVLFKFTP